MNRRTFTKLLAVAPLGAMTAKAETPKPKIKSKQKFLRGHKVHVNIPKTCIWMSHFDTDVDAIVVGSYRDQYGGTDCESYTLVLLDKKGVPYEECSWYEEYQLTLIDADRDKGEQILQSYLDEE